MSTLANIVERVREEGETDYVGIWTISRMLGVSPNREQLESDSVTAIVKSLLVDGTMVIGQFEDGSFRPWSGDLESRLQRLQSELSTLGRAPDIGEIGWLVAANSVR